MVSAQSSNSLGISMGNRAVIIDDHRLFGAGLSGLVSSLSQISDAQYCETPAAALGLPASDVRLVAADFFVPGYPASEWLPKLKAHFANAILVVVSSSPSRTDRDISEASGAVAFLEKHLHPELFLEQLDRLLDGGDPNFSTPSDPTGRLSPRQLDILVELCRGQSVKVIARHLGLSPETVKTHLSRLYRELNVSSRTEAVQWAFENGVC